MRFLLLILLFPFSLSFSQTGQNVNNSRENHSGNVSSSPSILGQLYFGGKYQQKYISGGYTTSLNPKWNLTFGGVYFQYGYQTKFFSIVIGRNTTTYIAVYSQVSRNYFKCFNNRFQMMGGLKLELSHARVIITNRTYKKVISITGPVLFLEHEIDYSISKRINIVLGAGIGYGNGIIKRGVDPDYRNDILTDRDNGYGELRFTYGLRYKL